MTLGLSKFGVRYARKTGSLELMDDLGRAMSGEDPALLLGGGNPGRIPEVEAIFRQRLREIEGDKEAFGRAFANYAHPAGERRMRESLASLLRVECDWDVTAENIALTAGSQASFFMLFNMLAGEMPDGSFKRILLPLIPEYVGYADLGLTDDFFVAYRPNIEPLADDMFKYRVDFEHLRITSDVAAVCVSRPTNPTGNVITDNELAQLDSLCKDADIPLIIDNAYGLPFPGIVFTDAQAMWNPNTICCLSLSKLGLPAVRTGIVVARPEIVEALTQVTAITNLAVGSVGPAMVTELMRSRQIVTMSRELIQPFYRDKATKCVEWLRDALTDVPFKIHRPEGAIFIWLWLLDAPLPSEQLYLKLKEAGVLVLSGHYFFPGLKEPWKHSHECLRISFAMDDDVVRRGIEILGDVIREIYSDAGISKVSLA